MPDDWRVSNWGDEVTLEYGKAIRGYSQNSGKYRVFGSNGPIGWTSDALTVGPGVVLGRKGAYRGVEFCRDPFWVIDTAYYIAPKHDMDMRWLYYAVKHYKLGEVDDGSPIPSTTRAAVYMLELDVPPKSEQGDIAHILGSLDDKIELNRKRSETLEAMARALFKAWFVDFEPVRAKMEGRWQRGQSLPGLPDYLYDVFPDRLVESELGEIPDGWDVSTLGVVCTHLNRGISPKYVDLGGVLVLNQKCIRDYSIDFSKARRHDVTQKNIDGRALELGDVLVNSTGVGTLGRVAQVRRLAETTIVDSHVTVVRSGVRINPMYLGGFMSMKQPEIEAMGEGSTGQTELSRKKLGDLKILLPKQVVLDQFAKQSKTFSESIAVNHADSETLSQLRDTLLPKLISGELRVPDAERIIGAAV